MYKMAFPFSYIWTYPGVYSLSVSYGNANTFYFSPVVGLSIINLCEFRMQRHLLLSYLQALVLLLLSLMLIFCRGHYFIDIFGGLVFGQYFWMFAERRAHLIDYGLLRIPFHKRFPYFDNQCGRCDRPINKWATFL
jgi:hypothetical protein